MEAGEEAEGVFFQSRALVLCPLSLNEEEELIRHLEEDHITRLLSGAMDALANAEREGRKDEANRLLNTCKELTQKLAGLKSARFLP